MSSSFRTACVIVTYNAPVGIENRIRVVLRQTDFVVVVDNGSAFQPTLGGLTTDESVRVHLIANQANNGLAAALNQGIAHAAKMGATHALLLDHDSTPDADMVERLWSGVRAHASPRLSVAAPRIVYAHPDIRCRWPSSSSNQRFFFTFAYADQIDTPSPVDLVIGSGMLLDIAIWERIGRFDEKLFIDLVDTEYCLRSRALGFEVLAVPDAILRHVLGDVSKKNLLGKPVFPTHHSAFRHYYLSRNRMILMKRFAIRFPNWLFYETMSGIKLTIKVALYEPQRLKKLWAMCRGTVDGALMAFRDRNANNR